MAVDDVDAPDQSPLLNPWLYPLPYPHSVQYLTLSLLLPLSLIGGASDVKGVSIRWKKYSGVLELDSYCTHT